MNSSVRPSVNRKANIVHNGQGLLAVAEIELRLLEQMPIEKQM